MTPGVDLAFSRIDGHLRLAGLQASGEVRAPGAQISGQLRLTAARLKNPGRNALNLDGATIESDVYLDDGFRAEGEVRALGAHIAGQLNLATAELTNPGRNTLNLDGATIDVAPDAQAIPPRQQELFAFWKFLPSSVPFLYPITRL